MDNKQKIIAVLTTYSNYLTLDYGEGTDLIFEKNYNIIADEIDALYHRDCGKCKKYNPKKFFLLNRDVGGCGIPEDEERCMWAYRDYYEEADK